MHLPLTALDTLPIITASFLSGAIASVSLLTIPVILETSTSANQLLHQWTRIYQRGHIQGPIISSVTGLLYAYAAWRRHDAGLQSTAACLTVGMIPYTWIFMAGTNTSLFAAAERGGAADRVEAERLVGTWRFLNFVRALFPLSGAVVGVLSLFS
ncbi:Noranthrone monooxygenase [Lecanosticta acicola]|uniref:Noranthrone monooxygenase n=1 Tax=Lecanosticta acicola TaxID=111012 RepID=A0AAI8W150_9PEZI|nr:Noranthrone monooxygenase [Lecanosticta acicola]